MTANPEKIECAFTDSSLYESVESEDIAEKAIIEKFKKTLIDAEQELANAWNQYSQEVLNDGDSADYAEMTKEQIIADFLMYRENI
jgi:hypothetical protein